jgi:hypothetical protein
MYCLKSMKETHVGSGLGGGVHDGSVLANVRDVDARGRADDDDAARIFFGGGGLKERERSGGFWVTRLCS